MTPAFFYNRGVCALQENKETIERHRTLAIVKNSNTNLFLIVQYTSNQEISFIAGGIEQGDSPEQTVRKELSEESGIQIIDHIQQKPERDFTVSFYSPHRDKNYCNHTAVYFVTTNQQILTNSQEEAKIQSPHRRTLDQIQQKIQEGRDNTNYESLQYLIDNIKNM